MNKKIEKFASNLLAFLLTNTIKSSLWRDATKVDHEIIGNDFDDIFKLENIQLEKDEASQHNYGKVICMLKGMLSSRFGNIKGTANILVSYFNSIDESIYNETI
jgi:hypothetical protein